MPKWEVNKENKLNLPLGTIVFSSWDDTIFRTESKQFTSGEIDELTKDNILKAIKDVQIKI